GPRPGAPPRRVAPAEVPPAVARRNEPDGIPGEMGGMFGSAARPPRRRAGGGAAGWRRWRGPPCAPPAGPGPARAAGPAGGAPATGVDPTSHGAGNSGPEFQGAVLEDASHILGRASPSRPDNDDPWRVVRLRGLDARYLTSAPEVGCGSVGG